MTIPELRASCIQAREDLCGASQACEDATRVELEARNALIDALDAREDLESGAAFEETSRPK